MDLLECGGNAEPYGEKKKSIQIVRCTACLSFDAIGGPPRPESNGSGFIHSETPTRNRIQLDWTQRRVLIGMFSLPFFLTMGYRWYHITSRTSAPPSGNDSIGIYAFPLMTLIAGYLIALEMFNRDIVEITSDWLEVIHGPIRRTVRMRINIQDLNRFEYTRKLTGSRKKRKSQYLIHGVLVNGQRKTLFQRVHSESQARQIIEKLESFMPSRQQAGSRST